MLRRFWQTFVLIVVVAFGAAASAAPVESYGRLPAIDSVEISEDGTMLAYVIARDEQQQVVVQRIAGGEILRRVAFERSKIRNVEWAGANHVLIYRSVTSAAPSRFLRGEFWQVGALNVRTGNIAQLLNRVLGGRDYENFIYGDAFPGTHDGNAVAYVQAVARTGPGQPDLVRVDLDSGNGVVTHVGAEESAGYLISREGALLASSEYTVASGEWRLSIRQGNAWRQVFRTTALLDPPWLCCLTPDGASVIFRTQEPDGNFGTRAVSLATGEITENYLRPGEYNVLQDHQFRKFGTGYRTEVPVYEFDDSVLQGAWNQLTQSFPNSVVNFESATGDYNKIVISIESAQFAKTYFIYDRQAQSLDVIGSAYPDVASAEIAEVRPITYRAGDGMQIPGYLTLPPGRSAQGLPLVVLVHGGPASRDTLGFDWMAQAIASRGYAVLQPNFRGSGGLTTAHEAAGYGQFGRLMQTDVSDGVAYLASQGVIDPTRVCIMGASYGGYAALAGVTLQSGVYRCAVSIAGVSDPGALLGRSIARGGSNSYGARYWMRYMGVQSGDDPRLADISPRRHATSGGNIPVLLIHGRDDTVVEYSHTSEMAQALRAAGRPVEVIDLRQEDHYLSREPTRIQTITASMAFIERHNPPN